ncbi:MAG: hypothetical protein WBD81_00345 [Collimonas pratensis]|uniref:hypothetical protein n=1 Tax=Collimonas pratensis TaxID=279113 RepID=UPI003C72CDF8
MRTTKENERWLGNEKEPALYFAFIQPVAPTPPTGEIWGRAFATHEQLLSYFETLPAPVQSNGLWVKRMAKNLWTAGDAAQLTTLIQAVKKKSMPLFVCEPKDSRDPSSGLVAWDCIKENPKGDSPVITCETTTDRDKASGTLVWECVVSGK